MAKSEAVEFEAWAGMLDGVLHRNDSYPINMLYRSWVGAWLHCAVGRLLGLDCRPVRVHVRVSVLDARGEKKEG